RLQVSGRRDCFLYALFRDRRALCARWGVGAVEPRGTGRRVRRWTEYLRSCRGNGAPGLHLFLGEERQLVVDGGFADTVFVSTFVRVSRRDARSRGGDTSFDCPGAPAYGPGMARSCRDCRRGSRSQVCSIFGWPGWRVLE